MQHTDPSPHEAGAPGGNERSPGERSDAAGLAEHIGDHHFEHPTVAPVSRPDPAATRQW